MRLSLKMKDYVKTNKEAFESLASQYNERWRLYLEHQEQVLKPLIERLQTAFDGKIKVLDVGCGVGLDLFLLDQYGFQVYGLDISSRMGGPARKNVPRAEVFEADFQNEPITGQYHGIVMDAFLHLFPKRDVPEILSKAKTLLMSGGYGLICTTKNETSKEGYFEKDDYIGSVKRFRTFWNEEELREILEQNDLDVVDFYTDTEKHFDKVWMNVIFQAKG